MDYFIVINFDHRLIPSPGAMESVGNFNPQWA